MNLLDFLVLVGSMAGIAAYGVWMTRGRQGLSHYLKGDERTGWAVIGVSVMATQASAVTFLSMPGQGYQDGLGFVQNYFGAPLALILIAAVFLPMYRRLHVYTAYEFLGRRFDTKTRLLGAALFLLQRGLQAGITVYAPAIILSTMLHWRTDATILLTGLVVIVYTSAGGSQAVNLTQKYQLAVILCGMLAAFVVLLRQLPAGVGLGDALALAGGFRKLRAVDFSVDASRRYTFWSGLLGGFFLALSYFGTDQSQVQRYLSGGSLRESRLGLMFNAVLKIPMQFFILLLGTMVFVFYQFETPPVCFNQAAWEIGLLRDPGERLRALERRYGELHAEKRLAVGAWLDARDSGDRSAEAGARERALDAHDRSQSVRAEAKAALESLTPQGKSPDTDYVFITFILRHLPHGLIGLLIAAFFNATLSSKAAELNALALTTTVDFYRSVVTPRADDAHYVSASRWFTVMWGLVAVGFALFASLAENLIQAVNIVASIFYGVVLGLFLVAFFLRWVQGTAVFWAAIAAQLLVFALFASLKISYLWYNLIGCAACVGFSLALQVALGPRLFACGGADESMTANPVICFGQQPCGFFPRRYLYAKIATARRLQAELGGEVVFFCHDSDHDFRETRTTLRHRKSGEPIQLNFAFDNQVQRKFSPLYLKRVRADWHARTADQLRAYVDPRWVEAFRAVLVPYVADFCLEMYRRMGLLDGLRIARSSDPAFRLAACDVDDYYVDAQYEGEVVRARLVEGRLRLHKGGDQYVDLPDFPYNRSRISPTRDTRLRWMQSVIRCTHYVAGASEQDYLRKDDAPEITYVVRDTIERADEAYAEPPT